MIDHVFRRLMEVREQVRSLENWFARSKHVSVRHEWLSACVDWIVAEEGTNVSLQDAQNIAYEQWLHGDMRETSTGGLPEGVLQPDGVGLSGKYTVQLDSVVNVGSPAYAQLQTLRGNDLDEVPDTDKKTFEAKPTRMLLLSLTDGTTHCHAMEYQPIPQVTVMTVPGSKLLLQGNIITRFGTLLLTGSHVTLLGGSVEQLVTENTTKKVLARKLNKPDLADSPTRPVSQGETMALSSVQSTIQSSIATAAAGTTTSTTCASVAVNSSCSFNDQLPTSASHAKRSRQGNEGSVVLPQSARDHPRANTSVVESNIDIGEEDIMDLGHFSDSADEQDSGDDPTFNPDNYAVQGGDENFPIDDEMLMELVSDEIDDDSHQHSVTAFRCDTSTASGNMIPTSHYPQPTTKNPSLKHDPTLKGAPSANNNKAIGSSSSQRSRTPIRRLTVISKEDFWLVNSVAYIKGTVLRLVDKLSHAGNQWSIKALITSGSSQITLLLGDRVLEKLIGFSAEEFTRDIEPCKNNPKIKEKGMKGFQNCKQVLYAMPECVMELSWDPTHKLPCVNSMWDM